jgi:hypothetical protein
VRRPHMSTDPHGGKADIPPQIRREQIEPEYRETP